MAAAIHDIVIEERSDFVLGITWYNRDGDPEHVDPYGAEFLLSANKDRGSTPLVKVTHESSPQGQIIVGDSPGEFLIRVDWSILKGLNFERGYWQLDIWPVAEEPDNKRQRLAKGKVYVDVSL